VTYMKDTVVALEPDSYWVVVAWDKR
jgi:hypothetical protein